MNITISSEVTNNVVLGVKGYADIIQCGQTLLSTIKGTVFLDRRLGLSHNVIDQPLNEMGKLYQETYLAFEKHEPRIEILEIRTKPNHLDGSAEIIVKGRIDEKYL